MFWVFVLVGLAGVWYIGQGAVFLLLFVIELIIGTPRVSGEDTWPEHRKRKCRDAGCP